MIRYPIMLSNFPANSRKFTSKPVRVEMGYVHKSLISKKSILCVQCLFYIVYDGVGQFVTFCTLHCIQIFVKMLKINFLKFFNRFPGVDFSSKNSISRKLIIIVH